MDWQHWIQRWDHTQEGYLARRDERFEVIFDVVERVTGSDAPRVLDLASGPGSLATRLLDRLPGARVVAVDADPVLHLLGQRVYGDRDGRLSWVLGDLAGATWVDAVGSDGPFDAAVSTTALHWLDAAALARCFAQLGALVRPGGVFVNGDHIHEAAGDRLRALQRDLRALPRDGRQEYRPWWADLEAAADKDKEPELAAAFAERARLGAGLPQVQDSPALDFHVAALRAAGFADVGSVWQEADNRVLVGLR